MSANKPGPGPIRKVIVRWACPFCPRESADKHVLDVHVPRCWLNPAAKTCMTCVNRIRPNGESPAACALGLPVPDGPKPVVNCPSWAKRGKPKNRPMTEDEDR